MTVQGLNHVNIVTGDLAATCDFYERVLGMEARPIPVVIPGLVGRWIFDAAGEPIIHVQSHNPERHGPLRNGPTGTIDHVALVCSDFAGTQARCKELGVAARVNDGQFGGLRQIFVTDPNDVVLELNFPKG